MSDIDWRGYLKDYGLTYCEGCIHYYLGPDYDCPKTNASILKGAVVGECREYSVKEKP